MIDEIIKYAVNSNIYLDNSFCILKMNKDKTMEIEHIFTFKENEYTITLKLSANSSITCSCPDFYYRGPKICKHINKIINNINIKDFKHKIESIIDLQKK